MSSPGEQKSNTQLKSDSAESYCELALRLKVGGYLDEAVETFKKAVRLNAADPDIHYNLANTYMSKGCWQDAIRHYRQALNINPGFADALNNLAVALKKNGDPTAAVDLLQQAVLQEPANAQYQNNLGIARQAQGALSRAMIHFKQAIALNPNFAEAYFNLGFLYQATDEPVAAVKCYQSAIRLRPEFFDAHNNLAVCLHTLKDLQKARQHYDQAVRIQPANDDARWNRSMLMLSMGEFEEGWREFEYRLTQSGWATNYPFKPAKPRWDGLPFRGRRLLVHDEQGFGDTIQFIRYLPLIKAHGGRILFETRQALVSLLNDFPGIDDIFARTSTVRPEPGYDIYTPLLSLPKFFKTKTLNIPFPEGYLKAHPEKANYWREKLGNDNYKVGIVWTGNPAHKNDRNRSCPLEQFKALMDLEGIDFISLQTDANYNEWKTRVDPYHVEDFGKDLGDFSHTAALIDNLDLVVSVDTAVVHLAGAMGKPVWVLLPYVADWRWMHDRSDSPWYRSARLFRQKKPGRWSSVFNEIREELRKVVCLKRTLS